MGQLIHYLPYFCSQMHALYVFENSNSILSTQMVVHFLYLYDWRWRLEVDEQKKKINTLTYLFCLERLVEFMSVMILILCLWFPVLLCILPSGVGSCVISPPVSCCLCLLCFPTFQCFSVPFPHLSFPRLTPPALHPLVVCALVYSLRAPSCLDGFLRFLLWVCRVSSEPVSSVSSSISPFVPTLRVLDFVRGFVSPLSSGLNFAFFVLCYWFVPCLAFCLDTVF